MELSKWNVKHVFSYDAERIFNIMAARKTETWHKASSVAMSVVLAIGVSGAPLTQYAYADDAPGAARNVTATGSASGSSDTGSNSNGNRSNSNASLSSQNGNDGSNIGSLNGASTEASDNGAGSGQQQGDANGNGDGNDADTGTESGSDENAPSGVQKNAGDLELSKPTVTTNTSSIPYGGKATFRIVQPGALTRPDTNGDGTPDSFKSLSITINGSNTPLAIDPSTLNVSTNDGTVVCAGLGDTSNGSFNKNADGTYTFTFSDDYLKNSMKYSGEDYIITFNAPSSTNMSDLKPALDADGNSSLSTMISVTTKADTSYGDTVPEGLKTYEARENISVKILMPKLSAARTVSKEKADMFEEVRYTVKVSNTESGTIAKNVVVSDQPDDTLASISGGSPTSVTVVKNGTAYALNSSNYYFNPGTGEMRFNIGDVDASSNGVTISYTVRTGRSKSDIPALTDLDSDDIVGKRTVTVKADNVAKTATASVAFDLLRPAVNVSGERDKTRITSGESSHITDTFTVVGADNTEDGATLKNPKISMSSIQYGTIGNVKATVDGKEYTDLNKLPNVKTGTKIILEYDVYAPVSYVQGSESGIDTKATITADNMIDERSVSNHIDIAVPKMSATTSVSTTMPSSEDEATGDHPVTVTSKFTQDVAGASATGLVITITDAPSDNGDPITDYRFKNIKINGVDASTSQYSIDDATGTLTIRPTEKLGGGESITVTYDDILKTGYAINGRTEGISASVGAQAQSSLPPNGGASANTSYTVQTPEMHNQTIVTDPVDTDGNEEVMNVGDTAGFQTQFYESNDEQPNAIGRDFAMDISLDDVKDDSGRTYTPTDLGVSFVSKDGVKADSGTDVPTDAENADDVKSIEDETSEATGSDDTSADEGGNEASQKNDNDDNADLRAVTIYAGTTDVTDDYNVSFISADGKEISEGDEDNDTAKKSSESSDAGASTASSGSAVKIHVTGKSTTDMTKAPTTISYKVKAGNGTAKNYDQLAGKKITVSAETSVTNLEKSADSEADVDVSDAKISVTKEASNDSIAHGDRCTYTVEAVNDKDNEFSAGSAARNIVLKDDIDASARDFGYRIDENSMSVSLGGKDITDSADVDISYDNNDASFTLKLARDLKKDDKLVITYDAITDGIDAGAYSQSLGNVVFATADNSKPAIATKIVSYNGANLPSDNAGNGSNADSGNGGDGTGANGKMSSTGDVMAERLIITIIIGSLAGASAVLISRRRSK